MDFNNDDGDDDEDGGASLVLVVLIPRVVALRGVDLCGTWRDLRRGLGRSGMDG